MTSFKILLLATAVGVVGLAGNAGAAAIITESQHVSSVHGAPVAISTPVVTRVVGGRTVAIGPTVAAKSDVAVGTRKVGHVGGRAYPIEKAHAENTIVTATPTGLVERTEVTTAGGPINIRNSGGDYYTETDGSFYADPAWDVNVHSSGGYND